MNIKKFMKKYYPSFLLIVFVLTLLWGIGRTIIDNKVFAYAENPQDVLKIVQFTDVHIDTASKSKAGRMFKDSCGLFEDAISQVNSINDVDLVVFSGDVINRPLQNDLLKFVKLANHLSFPWYPAMGNHDISVSGRLTKEKYLALMNSFNLRFNSRTPYYAIMPKKEYRIIFLDGVIDDKITARGHFNEAQLKWLDRKLSEYKKRKVVIVQHFPVIEPYKSENHSVDNADDYLDVLDNHENVVAVLAGHYHCAKIKKRNNVLHITTPSLVQYPNAFRVIKIVKSKQHTKVSLQLYETNLCLVQKQSKKGVKFAAPLLDGMPGDRDTVFYLSEK